MRIQKAKAYLSNGEVVDIKLLTKNIKNWIEAVKANGITTSDKYIPHHSITYILIDQTEDEDGEFEVEFEEEPEEPTLKGVSENERYQ